jgi:hypothetical protein
VRRPSRLQGAEATCAQAPELEARRRAACGLLGGRMMGRRQTSGRRHQFAKLMGGER